jgi:hypothetical protein
MDWKCGSSGKMAALQARSPEFKLQSHQKKKKKREREKGRKKEKKKKERKKERSKSVGKLCK